MSRTLTYTVIRAFKLRRLARLLQQRAAKSPALVQAAVYLRNQANMIIGYYLGQGGADHRLNGEQALIRRVAPHCNSFFDIGANVGEWTALFLQSSLRPCHGILFEPGSEALPLLQQRYSQEADVIIINAAVGAEEGNANFYEQPGHSRGASLIREESVDASRARSVPVTTVDKTFTNYNLTGVDYIKIDTEGNDYYVLLGMRQTLSDQQVTFIQFEYNGAWMPAGATLGKTLELLEHYGYETYLIHPRGLYKLRYTSYREYFSYSNYLAVANKGKPIIAPLLKGYI